jgi:hypothetical protein
MRKKLPEGLSYAQLVTALEDIGNEPTVEALLHEAYATAEKLERDDPHGYTWHTSFHVSGLPLPGRGCARQLVLSLMDLPDTDPIDEQGRGIMDAGKATEALIVAKIATLHGVLLSSEDSWKQTSFAAEEVWLTGNPDAIVLLGSRAHVLEFKGADNENERKPKIKQLRSGLMKPAVDYWTQLQGYMNLVARHADRFPGIDRCEDGSLVYFNRARPAERLVFGYERDEAYFDYALSVLAEARDAFIAEELPEQPFGGKEWGSDPCAWCQYKREFCKPAWKEGVKKLDDVVEIASRFDPTYTHDRYQASRMAVIMRWVK